MQPEYGMVTCIFQYSQSLKNPMELPPCSGGSKHKSPIGPFLLTILHLGLSIVMGVSNSWFISGKIPEMDDWARHGSGNHYILGRILYDHQQETPISTTLNSYWWTNSLSRNRQVLYRAMAVEPSAPSDLQVALGAHGYVWVSGFPKNNDLSDSQKKQTIIFTTILYSWFHWWVFGARNS